MRITMGQLASATAATAPPRFPGGPQTSCAWYGWPVAADHQDPPLAEASLPVEPSQRDPLLDVDLPRPAQPDASIREERTTAGGRGAALAATPLRWAASSAVVVVATLAIAWGYAVWSHMTWAAPSFVLAVATACVAESTIVLVLLRAEESRLVRALRVARKGTPLLRAMIARRRRQGTLLGRLLSTDLGLAAVLLADGDETRARDVLAAEPPWMDVGRLGGLRAVVFADAERTSGTPGALRRCIERLVAAPPMGNREADLYRTHVLVKAVLEEGAIEAAHELATRLSMSRDDDERVYGTWLRVWFDLDLEENGDWPLLADDDRRLALLLARSHGAGKLVDKLEARRVGIARTPPQG